MGELRGVAHRFRRRVGQRRHTDEREQQPHDGAQRGVGGLEFGDRRMTLDELLVFWMQRDDMGHLPGQPGAPGGLRDGDAREEVCVAGRGDGETDAVVVGLALGVHRVARLDLEPDRRHTDGGHG